MSRDLLKVALVCGAIAFAVMFGMELSSNGISSVYGPLDSSSAGVQTAERSDAGSAGTDASRAEESGRYGREPAGISVEGADGAEIPRLDHTPAIDKLANSAAEALQSASRGGIQFIVRLFDKTTK